MSLSGLVEDALELTRSGLEQGPIIAIWILLSSSVILQNAWILYVLIS